MTLDLKKLFGYYYISFFISLKLKVQITLSKTKKALNNFLAKSDRHSKEVYICVKNLGWEDSNLRMMESKSIALPLGDTP